MKLKFVSQKNTEGSITAEACICSLALILFISLFFTIIGYCGLHSIVRVEVNKQMTNTAIINHVSGMAYAGLLDMSKVNEKFGGMVKRPIAYFIKTGNEIRVRTSYVYVSPLGEFNVKFLSSFTAWEGDGEQNLDTSVWRKGPLERGKAIGEIFGSGLPEFFPVIDAYDPMSGNAVSVISVNTSLDSYRDGDRLEEVILEALKKLYKFSGARCEGFELCSKDIETREILVVVPTNPLNAGQLRALESCKIQSKVLDIMFTLKRYQKAY